MKKVLLHITLYFLIPTTFAQTVVISDTALKSCLVNNYPSLVDGNEDLIISAANNYNQTIQCDPGYIQDISVLSHFNKLSALIIDSNQISNVDVVLQMDSLEQLQLVNNNISSIPDLSSLTQLARLVVMDNQLTEFPNLPPTMWRINVGNNQISEIVGLETLVNLERFFAYNNGLDTISGYQNLTGLTHIQIQGNNLSSIPSFANLTNLTEILFGNNDLTWVDGLDNLPNLDHIYLGNCYFDSIPDIDLSNNPQIRLVNNYFTFKDFIPLTSWPAFGTNNAGFQHQRNIKTTPVVNIEKGDSWYWDLGIDSDVSSNYYLWYHDGVKIDSTISNTLSLNNIDLSDEGEYHCLVRNTVLDSVTITSDKVVLNVTNDFDQEEPYAFSPDGDGYADEFYIEDEGSAVIYNKRGEIVKKLTTPAFWDGTNQFNEVLDHDYYIIIVNDSKKYGVTIAR